MTSDLLSDLEHLGDLLFRTSDPITLDQIRDHSADLPDWPLADRQPDRELESASVEIGLVSTYRSSGVRMRHGRRVAAVIATAAAVVGALWLATWRPGADTGVGGSFDTTASIPTAPTVANGRVTFDAIPAGWSRNGASDEANSSEDLVRRVYATDSPSPETQPALMLTSNAAESGGDVVPGETVSVHGVDGQLSSSSGGGQSLAFGPVDGLSYQLIGYNISRDELIAAANTVHQSPDGYGAVIDAAGLPAGVTEKGAGFMSGIWFVSRAAAAQSVPAAYWTDGSGFLWYQSFADPELAQLGRFGFDSVTDTTVQGHPGFVATAQQDIVSIMWSDGARTFLLVSSGGLSASELRAAAQSMRPVTDAEWADMTAARATIQPTETTTTVGTSTATPPPAVVDAFGTSTPGAANCAPTSPIIGNEFRGTSDDGQLSGLIFATTPGMHLGDEIKLVVRMTGSGPLTITATAPDKSVTPLTSTAHTGSSFNRPGDEWDTVVAYPQAGCWQIHFERADTNADVWFQVDN